jgi:hypothetical protein
MSELFDKHGRPDLSSCADAVQAWAACEHYEDHVHNVADSLSEGEWDRLICDVRAVYAEYYAKFES